MEEKREELDYGPESSLPRQGVNYKYQWGSRTLPGGDFRVSLFPAVINDADKNMLELSSMLEARYYAAELESAKIVIALRVVDGKQNPLLRLERADYMGYLGAVNYASKLTGVKFDELAAPGTQEDTIEEPESIHWQIQNLRRLRKRADKSEASLAEIRLRVDIKHRHHRNT